MKITVLHKLYNSYGGYKSFTLAGKYLEYNMPEFGDAIQEIDITLHFSQDGPAKKSLESLHEKFHANLKTLPKCTFFRKKGRVSLDCEARFTTGLEIQLTRKPPIQLNPAWVKATLNEIQDGMKIIGAKIKKSDDFDMSSFEEYVNSKTNIVPSDKSALEEFERLADAKRKEEFNKLDEWEKLGIDWGEYHATAREIVNQPFLWSEADEFSPNGNDTGADTLGMFKDWNKRNKKSSALTFANRLLSGWEVDMNNPYETEYTSRTYFQSIVGLAFASAKLRGFCEADLKTMAIAAIEKYLEEIKTEVNWQYLEECQRKLKISQVTIEKMPNNALHQIN